MKEDTHQNPKSEIQGRASGALVEAEEEGELESSWREGRGLEPLITQPRAKKEIPASIAVPQACEYHLLYCLMANLHWSRRVAGSGFWISGGFGNRTLWPVNSDFGAPVPTSFDILGWEGEGSLGRLDSVMVTGSNFTEQKFQFSILSNLLFTITASTESKSVSRRFAWATYGGLADAWFTIISTLI